MAVPSTPGNAADVGGDVGQIAKQVAQLHGLVDFESTVRALRRGYRVVVNETKL